MPRSSKWPLSFKCHPLYASLFSPIHYTCPTHLIFCGMITKITLDEEYKP
jgi:hypothetical protein